MEAAKNQCRSLTHKKHSPRECLKSGKPISKKLTVSKTTHEAVYQSHRAIRPCRSIHMCPQKNVLPLPRSVDTAAQQCAHAEPHQPQRFLVTGHGSLRPPLRDASILCAATLEPRSVHVVTSCSSDSASRQHGTNTRTHYSGCALRAFVRSTPTEGNKNSHIQSHQHHLPITHLTSKSAHECVSS